MQYPGLYPDYEAAEQVDLFASEAWSVEEAHTFIKMVKTILDVKDEKRIFSPTAPPSVDDADDADDAVCVYPSRGYEGISSSWNQPQSSVMMTEFSKHKGVVEQYTYREVVHHNLATLQPIILTPRPAVVYVNDNKAIVKKEEKKEKTSAANQLGAALVIAGGTALVTYLATKGANASSLYDAIEASHKRFSEHVARAEGESSLRVKAFLLVLKGWTEIRESVRAEITRATCEKVGGATGTCVAAASFFLGSTVGFWIGIPVAVASGAHYIWRRTREDWTHTRIKNKLVCDLKASDALL